MRSCRLAAPLGATRLDDDDGLVSATSARRRKEASAFPIVSSRMTMLFGMRVVGHDN